MLFRFMCFECISRPECSITQLAVKGEALNVDFCMSPNI